MDNIVAHALLMSWTKLHNRDIRDSFNVKRITSWMALTLGIKLTSNRRNGQQIRYRPPQNPRLLSRSNLCLF